MDDRARPQIAVIHAMVLAVLAYVSPIGAHADALDNWTYSQVDTNHLGYRGDQLSGVAYGNGVYVAAGYATASDEGRLQTSQDGVNWTNQNSVFLDLYDVAFANGIFVAVGYD